MKQNTQLRQQLLISLGLANKEAKLYDYLLNHGEVAARKLEIESGLKKNTYNLLKNLEKKRLVIKKVREGKSYYLPSSPENLLELSQEQKRKVDHSHALLEELLPGIRSQYTMSVDKPIVHYIEGEEGLKNIFMDIYSPDNEEVYGCVDLEIVNKVFPDHILGELIPRRQEYGIKAFGLVADSPTAQKIVTKDKEQLRETILFDKKNYPLPAEIEIYKNKVAFMSFSRGNMVGMVVENKNFATSMLSIFRYLYKLKRELTELKKQTNTDKHEPTEDDLFSLDDPLE